MILVISEMNQAATSTNSHHFAQPLSKDLLMVRFWTWQDSLVTYLDSDWRPLGPDQYPFRISLFHSITKSILQKLRKKKKQKLLPARFCWCWFLKMPRNGSLDMGEHVPIGPTSMLPRMWHHYYSYVGLLGKPGSSTAGFGHNPTVWC